MATRHAALIEETETQVAISRQRILGTEAEGGSQGTGGRLHTIVVHGKGIAKVVAKVLKLVAKVAAVLVDGYFLTVVAIAKAFKFPMAGR